MGVCYQLMLEAKDRTNFSCRSDYTAQPDEDACCDLKILCRRPAGNGTDVPAVAVNGGVGRASGGAV